MRTSSGLRAVVLASAATLPACGGEGTLHLTIYGEDFVEKGIPPGIIENGWTMEFSRFLVMLADVDADGVELGGRAQLFDLTEPSDGHGQPVGDLTMPSGTVHDIAYRIAPASGAEAGNATADDVSMMVQSGYGLYVEGDATRGGETLSFAWGFDDDTYFHACKTDEALAAGGQATSQITIHVDHLLYDDLESPNAVRKFDLEASADSDGDGVITGDELKAVSITTLADYEVGSHTDVKDLWAFIAFQATTVGHVDGEGACSNH